VWPSEGEAVWVEGGAVGGVVADGDVADEGGGRVVMVGAVMVGDAADGGGGSERRPVCASVALEIMTAWLSRTGGFGEVLIVLA